MKNLKPNYIEHTGIIVSDMAQAIDFYSNTLGFELIQKVDDCSGEFVEKGVGIPGAKMMLAHLKIGDADTIIELLHYVNPQSKPMPSDAKSNDIGVAHVAFNVSDPDAYYEQLKSKGVEFISPGVMNSSTGERFCYFFGPDRVVLEFIKPPEGLLKDLKSE
jgi:catechol 2,3-dioxygenase-like lactoylglutathione lyase family enzyme